MNRLMVALLACATLASAQQKTVLAPGMSPERIREIERDAPGIKIITSRDQIASADAVIGGISPEAFAKAKNLKWVHITSAGVEKGLFPELIQSDVIVTNAKNVYGPQIADHAFAFLLALTRKLNVTIPKQKLEDWPAGRDGMFELDGKTAVIIGVGGIGSNIAQRAHGFGMKVIGVDPRDVPRSNFVQKVVPPDQLDSVLPEADVLFISAPHTKKSEGMMGPRQFELMKKGSYFIAVSRGKIYSHDGLVKALDSRRLAGAGLDVTDPEPLPKGDPLWKFDNVVITPHTAGGSDNLAMRLNTLVKENIRRFGAGQPLLNVVNKEEGY